MVRESDQRCNASRTGSTTMISAVSEKYRIELISKDTNQTQFLRGSLHPLIAMLDPGP